MRKTNHQSFGTKFLWIFISSCVLCARESWAFIPKSLGSNPRKSDLDDDSVGRAVRMESMNDHQYTPFRAITTRILMVGPILDDENGNLAGEFSSFASCKAGGISRRPGNGLKAGTAHGILCPETVSKMDQSTQGGRNNRAVKVFLDRYRRYGPMSCMELLSDPEILPHLTNAMRDLA